MRRSPLRHDPLPASSPLPVRGLALPSPVRGGWVCFTIPCRRGTASGLLSALLPSVRVAEQRKAPPPETTDDRFSGSAWTCVRHRGLDLCGVSTGREACCGHDDTDAGRQVARRRDFQRGVGSRVVVAGARVAPHDATPAQGGASPLPLPLLVPLARPRRQAHSQ